MKNIMRAIVVFIWFFFYEERFNRFQYFIDSGMHILDAFIIVYNGYY